MPQMTDTIAAKPRETSGKGSSHKLRKAGEVPAIVYGPGSTPRFLTIDPKTFSLQKQQFGISHIFDLQVDGATPFKALIREVQVNPVTQQTLHVDFYALDMTKPLKIEVPLEMVGKAAGIIDGGILSQLVRRIMVECLPNAIPEKVTVDVSPLTIGMSVKASDVKLPGGVKIATRLDLAVATMVAPAEEEVAATTTAEGAAVEGAEGAAPAAEGAAAAGEGAAAAAGGDKGDKKAAGDKAAGDKAAPAKGGKEGKEKK